MRWGEFHLTSPFCVLYRYVPLEVILNFPKVKEMTTDVNEIVEALKSSTVRDL